MKLNLRILGVVALSLGIFLISGCKKNSPNSSNSLYKSSTAEMNATSSLSTANTPLSDIHVGGGSLNLRTAWINIANLRIEENSGFDSEQEGEHRDGDQGGSDNESEDTSDSPDVTAPGPFSLDISNGQALIGSFAVYPGTFKKVDFTFMPNSNDPFYGKSIVIGGEFISNTGTVWPLTLMSNFSKQIKTQIAGGGITVPDNSTVKVNVVFNLVGWFGNIDFSTAQSSNGQILINGSENLALLVAFEANLDKYVEVEEKE